MSDGTQGEGWWQASDGKWYPPDQHPGAQAPGAGPDPTAAMPAPMPAPFDPPPPMGPPPTGAPLGAPMGPPSGPPAGAPMGPPPGPPGASNTKWIIGGVVVAVLAVIAAFLLLGGDSKKKNVAATNSSSSSSSSSAKSTTTTTKPKTTTTTSSSSSSAFTPQDLQNRMLIGRDIAPDFVDSTFTVDTGPTNCGETNLNQQVPPKLDIGSASSNGSAFFEEETKIYSSSSDADKVVDIFKAQTTCPSPTIASGEPVQFTPPKDISSSLTTPEEVALEIDFQTTEGQGQFFLIKDGSVVATFTFEAQQGFDTSQLPAAIDIVNKGLDKIIK